MEKEEIIEHLYRKGYNLLQERGIEWWKSQEIISDVICGAQEHFALCTEDTIRDFLQEFVRKLPDGVIKDKAPVKKLIDLGVHGRVGVLSEELLEDREILVDLIRHWVSFYFFSYEGSEKFNEELGLGILNKDYRMIELEKLMEEKHQLADEYSWSEEECIGIQIRHGVYEGEENYSYNKEDEEIQSVFAKIAEHKREMKRIRQQIDALEERIESLANQIIENQLEEGLDNEASKEQQTEAVQLHQSKLVRPLPKHVEDDVRRFEKLFLKNEEAIQEALQRESREEWARKHYRT